MFENLSGRLTSSLKKISGRASLSETNIRDTLREVRIALLDADVALPVVKEVVEQIRDRSLGAEVKGSLTPGQQFLKIVEAELTSLMGSKNEALNLSVQPPAVIMIAGLQGAGKTTTAAKLARYLRDREKKKVMLVSADVYRPAAIQQLEVLSSEVDAEFFESESTQKPEKIVQAAMHAAKKCFVDVLIVDTAGRLHVDLEMMSELSRIHESCKPIETLFVLDAMTGQDAANTATEFNRELPLTGIILTKVDGDARGGAALTVKRISGKPIKFVGVGEKTDDLELFHPERIASRILGMGDMLTLIEQAEQKVDKQKAKKLASKFVRGKTFDLEDLRDQLHQMRDMGGMSGMIEKLPGFGNMANMAPKSNVINQFARMEVIIDSMTPAERRNPDILNGSRKRRITLGSGTTIQDLNRLVKQYKQMGKMMKRMKGRDLGNMMRGLMTKHISTNGRF
ncbi:MAG: signal recognition particle protein [Cellvibrionales bacterium TMED49]|nr:MAG: signal recognition particle protein [Cellvibrionales bacterium TMED49]